MRTCGTRLFNIIGWLCWRYLNSCGLLEAAAQRVFGADGRLVLGGVVAVLAGEQDVVAVLDLLAALGVVVAVAVDGRRAHVLGGCLLVAVAVVVVQLGHLVDLDRGLGGVLHVDVDDVGAEH